MPGANLRMPLTSVAVRQRWKDPSLELKLQYHNVKKKERKKEIPHPAFRILLHTWFVSLEKSQLELEDYSIVKSSLQKNFISTILFFLIK